MTTGRKKCRNVAFWRGVVALVLAALPFIYASPAAALDLNPQDYFQLTYDPVTFDKVEIAPGGSFSAVIRGRATCSKSLPLPVSQATITSRVVAWHKASGTSLTLNASYVITIKPFPGKKGQTFEISQTIPLQFPPQAEPGKYTIIGQLIEARVKIFFFWRDVTGSLPTEQTMGTVKCVIPQPAPEPPKTATEAPPAMPPAPESTTTVIAPEPAPEPEQSTMPWWGKLLIIITGTAGIVGIYLFLGHSRKKH